MKNKPISSHAPPPDTRKGFTLIELSIVLVIIGLIVGGVLVGRDLIAAAQLRKYASEIEKFGVAINTFRAKYDCLPGDCKNATTFFSGTNNGNNDGKINGDFSAGGGAIWIGQLIKNTADNNGITEEVLLLNEHLAHAGLIPLAPFDHTAAAPATMSNKWYLTIGKKPKQSLFGIADNYGDNAIRFGGFQIAASNNVISYDPRYDSPTTLWPEEAFQIDSKIDDGLPWTGSVVAEVNVGLTRRDMKVVGSTNSEDLCSMWDGAATHTNAYNIPHNSNSWNNYTTSGYGLASCGLTAYSRY